MGLRSRVDGGHHLERRQCVEMQFVGCGQRRVALGLVGGVAEGCYTGEVLEVIVQFGFFLFDGVFGVEVVCERRERLGVVCFEHLELVGRRAGQDIYVHRARQLLQRRLLVLDLVVAGRGVCLVADFVVAGVGVVLGLGLLARGLAFGRRCRWRVFGSVVQGAALAQVLVAARVGVGVDPQVSRQLVGPAEALEAPGKRTGVGLLAGVGPYVSRLVLEAVESLGAERTLVRPRCWILAGLGSHGSRCRLVGSRRLGKLVVGGILGGGGRRGGGRCGGVVVSAIGRHYYIV